MGGSNIIEVGEEDIVIPAYTDTELIVKAKGLVSLFGYTKFDTGVIVPTSFVSGYTFPHSLGEKPKAIIIEGRTKPMMSSPRFDLLFWDINMSQHNVARMSGSSGSVVQDYNVFEITATAVKVKSEYFVDGAEHHWLFMA